MLNLTQLLCCGLTAVAATVALADSWPQFRGPDGSGRADSSQPLPVAWSETENILWKTAVPGLGRSSPVTDGTTVWLTTGVVTQLSEAQQDEIRRTKLAGNAMAGQMNIVGGLSLRAVAIDAATGSLRHNIELFAIDAPDPVHALNSFASPTPILDGNRLYCHFGAFGTACVDTATAQVVWRNTLTIDHSVGPGSSPLLVGDKLIIPCDGTDAQFIAALETATGEVAWKSPRPPMSGDQGEMHKAFSTPLAINVDGQPQVVIPGAQWVTAYDAQTGRELWRAGHGKGFSNVPRPVFGNGLVYICTGFMQPQLVAVRPEPTDSAAVTVNDLSADGIVWRYAGGVPTMSSPVLSGKSIIFVADNGVLTVLDAATGEVQHRRRLPGNYVASPLLADGKLYFCSREGVTTVLPADGRGDPLAENRLDGGLYASPAVLDGSLLLRTDDHLYRVGE